MSSNLVSISEDRDVATAAALMKMNRIRHLPVVNINNELSGILSTKDLAKAKSSKEKIKNFMTSPVQIVKKSTNIKTVIEHMLKLKISSILVEEEESIVGIVTTDDLIKLLGQLIDADDDLRNLEVSKFFEDSWSDDYESYISKFAKQPF